VSEANQPYAIRETERFGWQVEFELLDFQRWDEIKEQLDFYVATHPYEFEHVPGTELHAIPLATNPPLTVYYSIDEEERVVTFEGLHRS
jgi:hypothetical protein